MNSELLVKRTTVFYAPQRMFLLLFLMLSFLAPWAQQIGFNKLSAQLQKNKIEFTKYDHARIPLLLGNTLAGSLADPFGRGIYQTMFNDVWQNAEKRVGLPGLMLESAQFSKMEPISYYQTLDLQNGKMNTKVSYRDGYSYESMVLFAMGDKNRFLLQMKNTGDKTIEWYLRLPYDNFTLDYDPDSSFVKGFNGDSSFTRIAWSLYSDMSVTRLHYGHLKLFLKPGEEVKFIYTVYTHFAGDDFKDICFKKPVAQDYDKIVSNNDLAWDNLWRNTAAIIVPDQGNYARYFYRSLFWMYCVAGAERFVASEIQFANLTSPMAESYGYYNEGVKLDVMNWDMHPFTYGTSAWSAFAADMLGNRLVSNPILKAFYRPEALKWNANNMFPFGEAKVFNSINGHESNVEDVYLSHHNPNAWCYGHELNYGLKNIFYPADPNHWHWQLHVNGFAAANYVRYFEYFGDTVFLRQAGYPVLKGIAEFFSELMHYDPKIKEYVLPPTLSLAEDYFVRNPIESMLSAKYVLRQAAKYAAMLDLDKDLRKKWVDIAAKVHIPQNDKYYLEWDGDSSTRKGGGYEGIRGFCYFGFPTTEFIHTLDKDKMRRTLDAAWARNGKGDGMVIFSINWAALSETFLQNPARAMEMIDYGFDNWDPSGTAYLEVSPQKAYYHNSGITYIMLVATMALQTNDNVIKVFPAVPDQWKDFEFYDMPAYSGIRVSGKMADGKVLWVTYSLDGKQLLRLTGKKNVQIIVGKHGVSLKVLK